MLFSTEARWEPREPLDVRPQQSGLLGFSRTYGALTGRDMQRAVEGNAAGKVGEASTPHPLRYTFATRFLQAGGDLATLQGVRFLTVRCARQQDHPK